MNKIEWVCTECMWEGLYEDLEDGFCPECGEEVERPDDEPLWKYFGDDYNWNKI